VARGRALSAGPAAVGGSGRPGLRSADGPCPTREQGLPVPADDGELTATCSLALPGIRRAFYPTQYSGSPLRNGGEALTLGTPAPMTARWSGAEQGVPEATDAHAARPLNATTSQGGNRLVPRASEAGKVCRLSCATSRRRPCG